MVKRTANDWVGAALGALGTSGVDGVAVEPIARALRVTKGSFYWHFTSREELLAAGLARWEARTVEMMDALEDEVKDPRARLKALMERRGAEDFDAVHARLSGQGDNPTVAAALERLDRNQLDRLARWYRELRLTPADARSRALLLHASHLGMLRLVHASPGLVPIGAAWKKFLRLAEAALIP